MRSASALASVWLLVSIAPLVACGDDDQGWGEAVELSRPSNLNLPPGYPVLVDGLAVANDLMGNAIIGWDQRYGKTTEQFVGWLSPKTSRWVDSHAVNRIFLVAMSPRGRGFLVTTSIQPAPFSDARPVSASGLGQPIDLGVFPAAALGFDGDDRLLVVSSGLDESHTRRVLRIMREGGDGGFTGPTLVVTTVRSHDATQIATLTNGDIMVFWVERVSFAGAPSDLRATINTAGSWLPPMEIATVPDTRPQPEARPQLVAGPHGDAYIAAQGSLFRYSATEGWRTVTQNDFERQQPAIAAHPQGVFLAWVPPGAGTIAWRIQGASGRLAEGEIRSAATARVGEVSVSTSGGRALFAWSSPTPGDVWVAERAPNGDFTELLRLDTVSAHACEGGTTTGDHGVRAILGSSGASVLWSSLTCNERRLFVRSRP